MVWAVSHTRWLYGEQTMFHKPPPSPSSGMLMKIEMGLETLLYCFSAIWYGWQPKGVLLQTVPMKTSDCLLISIVQIISKNLPRCAVLCNVLQSCVCFQSELMLGPPKPSWRMTHYVLYAATHLLHLQLSSTSGSSLNHTQSEDIPCLAHMPISLHHLIETQLQSTP